MSQMCFTSKKSENQSQQERPPAHWASLSMGGTASLLIQACAEGRPLEAGTQAETRGDYHSSLTRF